jgi:SAM-dependent methyltransferase
MTADSVGIEQMPELAERARTQGLNVICGDLMSVVNSMPECEYDAVLLSHVLEHVENPIELLRAAHRLLKPGGRLVLGLPTERNVFRNLLRLDYFDGTHLYSFSIRNSFKLLEYVGFRPMHTCFHLPKYRGKSGERIHRIWNRLPFISKEWWSMAYWIIAEKN